VSGTVLDNRLRFFIFRPVAGNPASASQAKGFISMGKTRSYHDRFYYSDDDLGSPVDLVHQQAYAAQLEREAKIWQRRKALDKGASS